MDDLEAYCEMQRAEMWLSGFSVAEITVVEMCIAKLKQQLNGARERATETRQQSPEISAGLRMPDQNSLLPVDPEDSATVEQNPGPMMAGLMSPSTLETSTTPVWQDTMFPCSFPDYTNLQTWQEVIDSIGADFSYDM